MTPLVYKYLKPVYPGMICVCIIGFRGDGSAWAATSSHRVIGGRRDLLHDPKGHGYLCSRLDLVYDPKR